MTEHPSETNEVKKTQSIMGFSLTDALAPIGTSFNLFAHIIADTFAVYGMLPKDMPGLKDHTKQISLIQVLGLAWKSVKFTREGIPQALLFFSVIAVLVCGIFAVLSLLSSFAIGTAHAQPTSAFDEVPDSDVAIKWLRYLFPAGDQLTDTDLPTFTEGNTQSTFASATHDFGMRTALQRALGLYSQAMLIIATVILFYHLVVMTIQTAHSGVAMGTPQRQVWAPMRLVIAIGLLVPINSRLNSGQYIFIKMAELGSRVATHVWTLFVDAATDPTANASISAPKATGIATTMITNYACVYDYNARVSQKDTLGHIASGEWDQALGTLKLDTKETTMHNQNGLFNTWKPTINTVWVVGAATEMVLGENNICGWYFLPTSANISNDVIGNSDVVSERIQTLYGVQAGVFSNSLPAFDAAGREILKLIDVTDGTGGTYSSTTPMAVTTQWNTVVNGYQAAVNGAVANFRSTLRGGATSAAKSQIQGQGWAMAGAFLSTIARVQSALNGIVDGALPTVAGPSNADTSFNTTGSVSNSTKANDTDDATVRQAVFNDLGKFSQALNLAMTPGAVSSGTVNIDALECAGATGTPVEAALNANVGWGEKALDAVFIMLDYVAGWTNIWTSGTSNATCGNGTETFRLGITFSQGLNAMEALSTFGHSVINTGLELAAWGSAGIGISSYGGGVSEAASDKTAWSSSRGGELTGYAGQIAFALAIIFLIMGFPFAFLLPLMPFMHFFFGIIAWLGDVMEAVVAVPVVALAQLNPEGEGFVGKAGTAYHFIFGIALRPVLMVFGLIFGLLLFIIGCNFFTYAYGVAIVAFGGTAISFKVFSKLAFTAIYIYMIMTLANHCFQLVKHIPEHALEWLGAKMPAQVSLGDPISHMKGAENLASAWVLKESTQKLAGMTKSVGKTLGEEHAKDIGKRLDKENSRGETGSYKPGE